MFENHVVAPGRIWSSHILLQLEWTFPCKCCIGRAWQMNAVSCRALSHEVLLCSQPAWMQGCDLSSNEGNRSQDLGAPRRFPISKQLSFDKTIRIVGCSREEICRVENLMPVKQPFFSIRDQKWSVHRSWFGPSHLPPVLLGSYSLWVFNVGSALFQVRGRTSCRRQPGSMHVSGYYYSDLTTTSL